MKRKNLVGITRAITFALSVGLVIAGTVALRNGIDGDSPMHVLSALFFVLVAIWLGSVYPMLRDALD